ncbi:Tyrosine recombinase XerA [uncultured archaeon]|nr:Tyrosine recombinase XerA [uncultured archaeon]
MVGSIDLYNYQRRLELSLRNMEDDPLVCTEDKASIASFSKVKLAKGSSAGRVAKVVYCLRYLSRWLKKPYNQATKDDLIALVGGLEGNQNYSEYTKYDYKAVLKMYFKWLRGNDEEFPPEVKWLKIKLKNENHKLPEDLLTEDEVLKLANAANHPRDKALILVLYETGCRIGELLSLRMKHVHFDQYGAVLRVSGKTGDRRVRIISSAPTLASWIDIYERAKDPDAPLWLQRAHNHKNPLTHIGHRGIYELLRDLAKKAGVRKRIYPHLFRHSRATALAGKFTEAQMKEYFGWVQGSDMAATYVHLSGRDVDDTLLRMHGLTTETNKEEDKMKVRICQRCKEQNSPIAKFCTRCGQPMDAEFVSKLETEREKGDNLMNKLMEDKEFRELVMRKMAEPGFLASK